MGGLASVAQAGCLREDDEPARRSAWGGIRGIRISRIKPLGYEAMRALVTGGAGFIGSNLADALLARGHEVHVLDDLSKGRRERLADAVDLHVADIREPDEVFDAVRPEVVFHLAAQADVRSSVDRPDVDAEINVLGTIRVLEAARRHDAQLVFASTGGAIYGECDGPAGEDSERRPLAPYGASKLCGEEYLATWNRLYGTRHVALRFGNVFGPRQEPHGEAGVVAIFMGLLRDGGTPKIYGDGAQTRDYVYVHDVVGAVLAAIGHGGGVFNVGTGVETSVLELYRAIEQATGIERPAEHAEPRLGELQRSVLDPSAAGRELGWRPQTTLAEGLRQTWDWVTSQED
jgi:UDP-glucose 4-epimerase